MTILIYYNYVFDVWLHLIINKNDKINVYDKTAIYPSQGSNSV